MNVEMRGHAACIEGNEKLIYNFDGRTKRKYTTQKA
jgi:hypothetical protein